MTDEHEHAMKVAKVIAKAMGDNFSDAFKNKQRWTSKRGMSGGRFRDVNEPFQDDYIAAAQAAIAALDAVRGDSEPVAWLYEHPEGYYNTTTRRDDPSLPTYRGWIETPLYAHPPRGDQVARVVEWLRKDADQTEIEAGHIVKNSSGNPRKNAAEWAMLVAMKRGLADAIERGDPFNG